MLYGYVYVIKQCCWAPLPPGMVFFFLGALWVGCGVLVAAPVRNSCRRQSNNNKKNNNTKNNCYDNCNN